MLIGLRRPDAELIEAEPHEELKLSERLGRRESLECCFQAGERASVLLGVNAPDRLDQLRVRAGRLAGGRHDSSLVFVGERTKILYNMIAKMRMPRF